MRWVLALPALALAGCPLAMHDDYYLAGARDAGAPDAGAASAAGASGAAGAAGAGSSDAGGGAGSSAPGWVAMSSALPPGAGARDKAAYAVVAGRVFIWGGAGADGHALDSGLLYDPATDTWSAVAVDASTPSPRVLATAVAVGDVVVVWGGGDAADSEDYDDGAIYDPGKNAWAPMKSAGAPPARRAPVAAGDADRAVFWGGWHHDGTPVAGAFVYSVGSGKWTPAPTGGDPGARLDAAVGTAATELFVYGGEPNGAGKTDHAQAYSLASNTWTPLPNGPSQRWGAAGAWDGAHFVVWGGQDGNLKIDGKLFDPLSRKWTPMASAGAPSGRWMPARRSGWSAAIAAGKTLLVGGVDLSGKVVQKDGGIYAAGAWTPVAAWPSAEDHLWGVGVWAKTAFVLWGGDDGGAPTATGERYLPR